MNKRGFLGGLIFFFSVFALSFVVLAVLIPKSDPQLKKSDFLKNKKISLNYIAIGDSLTEGVGDLTNQGGFVPLLSGDLGDYFNATVNTENYGVSGNTSQQILTRMTENKEITEQLKKANLMTLTVGGNDVLAVIRKNLANLKVSSFKKPARQYQERLRKILDLARKDNQDLPIFVLGIYNPFYLNFQELTEMQTVINDWNKKTQEVVDDYDHVYFVPINDLLYKGVDGKEGIVQSTGEQTTIVNDALFSGDHFHPNNTGYQIMSDAVMETIRKNGKEIKP
ncbi:TPA: SGNH/GDSL hydrolase family protein [Streptococcus equi subsp. zooepidemicus]|uniref:Lipase/acylhydrolase with GDSL-like motif n=1 Tax=Streptococcus equi subsp. zooepidemicus (strain MGCS10565) TaxID=552526 RepID=B4U1X5_STREM|nr:SGNH/GDSL hydrolase family protein [Streptococcus equi]VED85185.1 GDSL-like lipase/acylhydrolase protein [Streptococcus equi subsp. equi]ACG61992.1 lipase/acylhydrolase with GDSL-like motif [Streptococcus equi subsp. zooepidemicus MGCS10565]MCD3400555.1 SGNH/GDSL hydrolase family protein [Streptococcus equi subsp. zooepidemicus]MCD3437645.1 SGNH/GDSL hydrolase family protein [Streptococcus equi subsp. zooepidemicus]MDI6035889.1 SGNH/GDSL hydrolase family protein [Streptococcus equi subsp. z